MPKINILDKLEELRQMTGESETVEFKRAECSFDNDKLGKYFSALSNEANLKRHSSAWLIFGIDDKSHEILGSRFRQNPQDLQKLKLEIAAKTTNRITFIEIHSLQTDSGRVILFEIPPAPRGIPIAFDGHYYGREGTSLSPLNIEEIEQIRAQMNVEDWSKGIISDATLDDLDPEAIRVARINFKVRNRSIEAEIDQWDDMTFLNKAKVTIRGTITRTAIILLGRSEAEHFLSPATARIRWLLKDSAGHDRDYFVTGNPFLLAVDKIYAKIRNLKYRYLPKGTLFPQEVDTYAPFVIREAVNNCIAHQNYLQGTFINVVELEDRLIFSNRGSFLPDSVEKVVLENAPEEHYRNTFLVAAMYNLNLIETRGGGIRRMFEHQRDRFFPMPDYELSPDRVQMTVIGKVLDLNYANVLTNNPELSLEEIILLDKTQKKKHLTENEEKYLRKKKLIEGRKPNFHIAKEVAQTTEQKPEYTKLKGFDSQYYQDLLLKALAEHGSLARKEIDRLLHDKLPDVLTEEQKTYKITNLLTLLKNEKKIQLKGWSSRAKWESFAEGEETS